MLFGGRCGTRMVRIMRWFSCVSMNGRLRMCRRCMRLLAWLATFLGFSVRLLGRLIMMNLFRMSLRGSVLPFFRRLMLRLLLLFRVRLLLFLMGRLCLLLLVVWLRCLWVLRLCMRRVVMTMLWSSSVGPCIRCRVM